LNSRAGTLWRRAKRNFYYYDNPSRAGQLCNLIITQFALTEEADEAKLLLHDVRTEIRRLVAVQDRHFPRPVPESRGSFQGSDPFGPDAKTATRSKIPLATAIVALPILGIARDGFLGIALPEMVVFVAMTLLAAGLSIIQKFYQQIKK
jgi:hypothetical protein